MLAPAPAALVFSELALPLPQALSRPTAPRAAVPPMEGAAAEAVLGRFVATRGVCGVGGHGSCFLLLYAGGYIPYSRSDDYLCMTLHNFV